jgi:hypothetical protein
VLTGRSLYERAANVVALTAHHNERCKEAVAMENPILDFTDTLAKRWRAHNAGAIAAAHARGLGPVFNFEPAPQPAPRRRPHRTRPPSLTKALREAKKAGIPVTGATFTADSVSLSFGEAAKSNGNDLDQWLAGRHENPTKGH